MSEQYFTNFPKIYYNGQVTRNIILKAKFFRDILSNYAAFYPYTVKDDDRADTVALHYYGKWEYDWLVYMSNEMIDPYFSWPMDQQNFERYIVGKYGSYEKAVDKIDHYEYNSTVSENDEGSEYKANYRMTPETYGVMLTEGSTYKVDGQDILVGLYETVPDPAGHAENHRIWVMDQGKFLIKKSGVWKPVTISEFPQIGQYIEEISFWKPVSAYENEFRANEQRRNIRLLDNRLLHQVEKELAEIFK